MRRHRWILISLLALVAFPAYAQEPGPPAIDERLGLSLEAAVARALEREPSLVAVRADADAARGLRAQAALRPNPTLTFEQRDEPRGSDKQTSIGLEWPLDLFGRAGRVQASERDLEVARLAVSDRERILASEVRRQYGLAGVAIRDLSVAEDARKLAAEQLAVTRARADSGRTPPLEANILEVEVQRLEARRLVAAGRVDAAFIELKRLIGMAPDEPLQIRNSIEMLVSLPATAQPAAAVRSDVAEAAARVAQADARVELARREGRFDLNLFANYMRMDAGFPQQGLGARGAFERVRGQFHYVAAGAAVMLPLFDRNQGRVASAQAEKAASEARRDATDLNARAEVASARAAEARAQQAVRLYSDSVRALARQNLDVVRQTFDLGRATVFDVLSEQRRLLEVEEAYTAALRDAWEARVALTRALGGNP